MRNEKITLGCQWYLSTYTRELLFHKNKFSGMILTIYLAKLNKCYGSLQIQDLCNDQWIDITEKRALLIKHLEADMGGGGKKKIQKHCLFSFFFMNLIWFFYKSCTDAGIMWAFGDCQTLWLWEEFFWGEFYWFQLENPSPTTISKIHMPTKLCLSLPLTNQKANVHSEGYKLSHFLPCLCISTIYWR